MNQNQKKKQMTRGLTIGLALLVVAAICITVIAVVSSRRSKPGPSNTTGTQNTNQTTKNPNPEETTTNPDDKPIVADEVTFISPMTNGNISKEWSAEIPVYSDTMEDYRVHLGVDIEADAGTPVYAAADGIVETVEFDPMMGQTIVISHASGYKSVYRNLQTNIPEGFKFEDNTLKHNIEYYDSNLKRKEISLIKEEIRKYNKILYEWASNLPDNKRKDD